MAKMCTVSRLERQFATLYLFHAPTGGSRGNSGKMERKVRNSGKISWIAKSNNVQTRCIGKCEAQKSPLFWQFSGGLWFSQERLFSRHSTRKPLSLIKSPIFRNAPCKFTCFCNAPSLHSVEKCMNYSRISGAGKGKRKKMAGVPILGAGCLLSLTVTAFSGVSEL